MSETPGIGDERATAMAAVATTHAEIPQAFVLIALMDMLKKLVVPPPMTPSTGDASSVSEATSDDAAVQLEKAGIRVFTAQTPRA